MPRPRSDEKRTAILEAATRVIVAQGLSAPTADIAREAGVANGSLFTYFETKAILFNQLYLELKAEIAAAATTGLPKNTELKTQLFHVWRNWTTWAISFPGKRKALAQLTVSSDITEASHAAGRELMSPLANLADRCRRGGPMRKSNLGFVLTLMNSVAEATMGFMIDDKANAQKHCKEGFEALWRMVN